MKSTVLALLFSALHLSVYAADVATPQVGSRDQLRACNSAAAQLTQQRAEVDAALRETEAMLKQVQESAALLEGAKQTIRSDDAAATNKFNVKKEKYNRFAAQYNERALKTQALSDAYNKAAEAQNRNCATLVFSQEDRDALRLEQTGK